MFELFFDNEIINYLVDESQRYAQFINQPDPKISLDEMRCFLGVLLLTGYNELPSKRMYWDFKDDVKNEMVSKAMRRNRFLQIQRFLHCADNTKVTEGDTAWKIRPLMDNLKKKVYGKFHSFTAFIL